MLIFYSGLFQFVKGKNDLQDHPVSLCLKISYKATAQATEAFKDETAPFIGMEASQSERFRTRELIP